MATKVCTRDDCPAKGTPHDRCSAHKRPSRGGGPCANWPLHGQQVCRQHGGQSPQALGGAKARLTLVAAQEAVQTLGLPRDVSPTDALLEEVRWTAGHVGWLRERVAELGQHPDDAADPGPGGHPLVWARKSVTDKGSGESPGVDTVEAAGPSVWYELYARERQHLVKVCAAAIAAGIEERRVRLAEDQGALVAGLIRRILDRLDLSPAQQLLVGEVVPAELRALAVS